MEMKTTQETVEWQQEDSWNKLIAKGDGYLTPRQRQVFELAIRMVMERLQVTLSGRNFNSMDNGTFNFPVFIEEMEGRLLKDTHSMDDLYKDAALTAFRVVEKISSQLLKATH